MENEGQEQPNYLEEWVINLKLTGEKNDAGEPQVVLKQTHTYSKDMPDELWETRKEDVKVGSAVVTVQEDVHLTVDFDDGVREVRLVMKSPLMEAINVLTGEFLSRSDLGNASLNDIFLSAAQVAKVVHNMTIGKNILGNTTPGSPEEDIADMAEHVFEATRAGQRLQEKAVTGNPRKKHG